MFVFSWAHLRLPNCWSTLDTQTRQSWRFIFILPPPLLHEVFMAQVFRLPFTLTGLVFSRRRRRPSLSLAQFDCGLSDGALILADWERLQMQQQDLMEQGGRLCPWLLFTGVYFTSCAHNHRSMQANTNKNTCSSIFPRWLTPVVCGCVCKTVFSERRQLRHTSVQLSGAINARTDIKPIGIGCQ